MKRKDLLDRLQAEWARERPELASSDMGIVGRIVLLGELLKRRAGAVLAPYDIGYTDFDVLATLRRSGAPYALRPAELLRRVLIQSGSLTACLDRLHRKGFLERVSDPTDRRGKPVRLTPDGLKLVEEAIAVRFSDATASVSALSEKDRKNLERVLRELVLAHSAADPKA